MPIVSDYEPDDFQLQLQVFSPTLILQMYLYKTGSWNSDKSEF